MSRLSCSKGISAPPYHVTVKSASSFSDFWQFISGAYSKWWLLSYWTVWPTKVAFRGSCQEYLFMLCLLGDEHPFWLLFNVSMHFAHLRNFKILDVILRHSVPQNRSRMILSEFYWHFVKKCLANKLTTLLPFNLTSVAELFCSVVRSSFSFSRRSAIYVWSYSKFCVIVWSNSKAVNALITMTTTPWIPSRSFPLFQNEGQSSCKTYHKKMNLFKLTPK